MRTFLIIILTAIAMALQIAAFNAVACQRKQPPCPPVCESK